MTHNKSPKKLSQKILTPLQIFCCFTASLFFIFLAESRAQSPLDQQDWITRNQQNIIEEEKRAAEFRAIKKDRERKKKAESEEEIQRQNLKVSGKPAACFLVNEIRLIDANLISARAQKKLTAPF